MKLSFQTRSLFHSSLPTSSSSSPANLGRNCLRRRIFTIAPPPDHPSHYSLPNRWTNAAMKRNKKERKKKEKKEKREKERVRIFPSNVFHEQFLSTPTRRHHGAHLPRNSRSPAIVHRGNYYSHFSRCLFPLVIRSDDGKLHRRRGIIKKKWRKEKERKKSRSLVGHAKLPFSLWKLYACVLDSCGRTRERRREGGKKRNENVRRGWRTGEKAGEYRLDSRKGLSTFSHDTICCRHLTDNASAGAKYVFQLYLFPLSFSRRGLFAKLPDHRGIPRVCNCVRGCLSLELFLDWSQQCLLRRERVETTGGGAFEVAKRYSHAGRGWKFIEIFILEIFIYRYSILEFFLSSYMQWLKWSGRHCN